MQAGTKDQAGAVAPASAGTALFARVYAIDDNREGVARRQEIDVLSQSALNVIETDLKAAGFVKVTDIADGQVTSGKAAIFYKPGRKQFMSVEEHAHRMDVVMTTLLKWEEQA